MVAPQPLPCLVRGSVPHRLGHTRRLPHAGRCHPRSEREPGDRLRRLGGALAAGGRGSGHLPALGESPGPGRREDRARRVDVRLLDGHDHLRGSHGQLLRSHARAGAAEPPGLATTAGSRPATRPGRHRSWLGLSVLPGRRSRAGAGRRLRSRPAPRGAGLVCPLPVECRSRRGGSRQHWRLRAPVPDRGQLDEDARRGCAVEDGDGGRRTQQSQRRREGHRGERHGVRRARHRPHHLHEGSRRHRAHGARRHAGLSARHRHDSDRRRLPAGIARREWP